MSELGEVWCSKCAQRAEAEYRQADGSTVALCRDCTTWERWKEGNVNWQGGQAGYTKEDSR